MTDHRTRETTRAARPGRSGAGGRSLVAVFVFLATAGAGHAVERRVVIERDGREPLSSVATGLAATRFAATGVVECGGMRGVGQITGARDVVTSAAHVFFDEEGRPRAEHGECVFVVDTTAGRQRIPLAADKSLCGSTSPYGVSGRKDWAAARLAHPVPGIAAYAVGPMPKPGDPIAVVAFEHGHKTVDLCRVRDVLPGEDGAGEIRTDCVGFDGMSGAAYLSLADGRAPKVVGVHVGFRSSAPDEVLPYSARHHTFGSSIGRVLRRALEAAR